MDHHDFIVCSFMENSNGLRRAILPPNTCEKVLETLYQEENTCAKLRLKGQDYRITEFLSYSGLS